MNPTNNQLICDDAALGMATLPQDCVDLLIADPPYNLGKHYGNNRDKRERDEYTAFTQTWLTQARRILKPTGSIYVFMGVRFIADLFKMLEDDFGFYLNSWITWHYTQGMGRKIGFSPRHEDILFFTKSKSFTFNLERIKIPQKYYRKRNNMSGANPGDVWQFSHVHYCSAERRNHPTQKPEALIKRIIEASSNPHDLVLDPFVGSGTTCRVANFLGRQWIGIDVNPEYIQMSKERIDLPFEQFDSYDPRDSRIPKDLPHDDTSQQSPEHLKPNQLRFE